MFYLILFTDGQSAVEVQLVTRKFVEKGSSITLQCRHNVEPRILHKVCFHFMEIYLFVVWWAEASGKQGKSKGSLVGGFSRRRLSTLFVLFLNIFVWCWKYTDISYYIKIECQRKIARIYYINSNRNRFSTIKEFLEIFVDANIWKTCNIKAAI